ncbi:hypothetical protein N566_21155 [Streptomycetaceae bacterium MP113-05]|nr:hypothetical protein N566_21155 [Streptomycetaceae bacterium MP113-05]
MNADQTRISNIEAGRIGISEVRLRRLACHYDCTDQGLVEALVAMVTRRGRKWWDEYRGVLSPGQLDLAELEHHAAQLRTAQITHIPGLFQTVDHARSIFSQGVPPLPPHEIEHRISFRIKRQELFHREDPTPYTGVIHEAALRMQFGGRAVARRQLDHILEMSERESLTVLVVPFASGDFPGAGHTICYASGEVRQLDTVMLDASHGPELLDAEAQLDKYQGIVTRMEELALPPSPSRDFIRAIAHEL